MGLLDDAIRDHLELKRQHGADPREVAQLERGVFGSGAEDDVDGATLGAIGQEPQVEAGQAPKLGADQEPQLEAGTPSRSEPDELPVDTRVGEETMEMQLDFFVDDEDEGESPDAKDD